ncbi:MAG TPA: hypothetical protein ENG35_05495, partial [Desulfobacteraceae bacterium]|nr:hypothetical protein [Desulfobacteraceae bacterium]
IDKSQIMNLATCIFMGEMVSVLIVGPCGTGKSHIAQAIGHCAIRQENDVLFTTQAKMLSQLHAAHATNSYERKLKSFITTATLECLMLQPMRAAFFYDYDAQYGCALECIL